MYVVGFPNVSVGVVSSGQRGTSDRNCGRKYSYKGNANPLEIHDFIIVNVKPRKYPLTPIVL